MAHEIEMVNGAASMFFRGETPWHGLGTKIEGRLTSEQAIRAAGLDWKVGLKDLQTTDGIAVSHKATYRETDGKILGVVGPTWKPLQNADAFGFFDAFVAAGQASYETAGSLQEGRRVWILAAIESDPLVIVPQSDDVVRKFILLSNSHDGTLAIRAGFTPVRVVCANTLAMAHNDDASALVKIRHGKHSTDALAKLADVMNVVNQRFEATADQYRALARTACDDATLKKYVNMVFAPKRVKDAAAAKSAAIAMLGDDVAAADLLDPADLSSRVYGSVAELFAKGRGNDLPGVKGTLWGAYNAITEYIGHERGKDAAKRLDSAWFGQGHTQNRNALRVGYELAKGRELADA